MRFEHKAITVSLKENIAILVIIMGIIVRFAIKIQTCSSHSICWTLGSAKHHFTKDAYTIHSTY